MPSQLDEWAWPAGASLLKSCWWKIHHAQQEHHQHHAEHGPPGRGRHGARPMQTRHAMRQQGGAEVDLVLEDRAGRLVGVEVKCTATLRPQHFGGLKALKEAAGDRFVRGVVVYVGAEVVPFGKHLHGLPVGQVWG